MGNVTSPNFIFLLSMGCQSSQILPKGAKRNKKIIKACQNSEIDALGFYFGYFGIFVHFLRLYEFLEHRAPVQTQAPETMFVGYQMGYTSNKQ